jgi:hypothetical protein
MQNSFSFAPSSDNNKCVSQDYVADREIRRCIKTARKGSVECQSYDTTGVLDDDAISSGFNTKEVSSNNGNDKMLMFILEQIKNIEIDKTKKSRKPKPVSDARIRAKAMLLYYHDVKQQHAVISSARFAMEESGLYKEGDKIPWQVVKKVCDSGYEILTDAQKDSYLEKARAYYEEKNKDSL